MIILKYRSDNDFRVTVFWHCFVPMKTDRSMYRLVLVLCTQLLSFQICFLFSKVLRCSHPSVWEDRIKLWKLNHIDSPWPTKPTLKPTHKHSLPEHTALFVSWFLSSWGVCACLQGDVSAGSAVDLWTCSHVAVFNQRTQSAQHMACPDLVLSDSPSLGQTRCDRPVWVKRASQKPSGWTVRLSLMLSCVAALRERETYEAHLL